MKQIYASLIFSALCGISLTIFIPHTFAQSACGSIINIFGGPQPIIDCANPFAATASTPSIGPLTLNTTPIQNYTNIALDTNKPISVSLQVPPGTFMYTVTFYKNEGSDFIYQDSVNNLFTQPIHFTNAGTYTAVIEVTTAPPVLTQRSLLEKIYSIFIPTVYAQIAPGGGPEVKVITFTVTDVTASKATLSNILFLPGIQASRLYSVNTITIPDYTQIVPQEKVWEPSGNKDVQALAMTDTGTSLYTLYTKDVIDQLPISGANIYKGFLASLHTLGNNGPLSGLLIETFPYDWRYDVFDTVHNGTVLQNGITVYPTSTVALLAGTSPTGKVTLIAHSNGGLLAKAIMIELAKEGKADLVDKIIFIGTPQLGTPKAIATVLHGYDQQILYGGIVDAGIARNVIQNLPGVYSLLPSVAYMQKIKRPLITFDTSPLTKTFRDAYGLKIDTLDAYTRFMNGTENPTKRTTVAQSDIASPTVVNTNMFATALQEHRTLLDTWRPATSTKVYNIIGTGLQTVRGITYRQIKEKICTTAFFFNCTTQKILKPYAQFTTYGDETVVSASAKEVASSTETWYVDLNKNNHGITKINRAHADLTETPAVQTLVKQILYSSSTNDIPFITTTEPISTKTYTITSIDSPVRVSAIDTSGNVSGVVDVGGTLVTKEGIPGSHYMTFGDTKYLLIPNDIAYTVYLKGEAYGTYTLTLATLDSYDIQTIQVTKSNNRVTPTMTASFTVASGTIGMLQSDLNGDGTIDTTYPLITPQHREDDEDEDSHYRKKHTKKLQKKKKHHHRNNH